MNIRKISKILTATVFVGTLIYIISPHITSMFTAEPKSEEALESLREQESLSGNRPDATGSKLFNEKTIDYSELHRRFPGNRALPALSKNEAEAMREAREERRMKYAKIVSNKATDEEVEEYYREQTDLTRDTIELVDFILKNYDSKLEEKSHKKYTFLKEQFELRLQRIPKKEDEAMTRIKAYRKKHTIKP